MGKKELATKLFCNLSLEEMISEAHIARELDSVLDLSFGTKGERGLTL